MASHAENRVIKHKEFLDFLNELEEYELAEDNFQYQNAKQYVTLKHKACGTIWKVKISKFWGEGSRCPKASCFTDKRVGHLREPNEQKIMDLVSENGPYELLEPNFKYKNRKERIKLKHKACGMIWDPLISNLLCGFTKCPNCKNDGKKEHTTERLRETLDKEKESYVLYKELDKLIRSSDKIEVKHLKCGTIFNPTVHNFLDAKSRCPKCCNTFSKAEQEIFEFVKSIDGTAESRCRSVVPHYELDIYVPSKKFAIEYNGFYWHGEDKRADDYHKVKSEKCAECGIDLMHIFPDEWRDKREIIESMIRYRLGLVINSIFASKCSFEKREASYFFENNHVSGNVRYTESFCLIYNDEIVAALSLRRPFHVEKYVNCIEIARFAVKKNFKVPGAFSKLFNVVKIWAKEQRYNKIITYADLRFGKGKVYELVDFKLLGVTPINYWYTDGYRKYNRFKYRAQNGKTEKQVSEENKVWRVYGCGSNIYEYVL